MYVYIIRAGNVGLRLQGPLIVSQCPRKVIFCTGFF